MCLVANDWLGNSSSFIIMSYGLPKNVYTNYKYSSCIYYWEAICENQVLSWFLLSAPQRHPRPSQVSVSEPVHKFRTPLLIKP